MRKMHLVTILLKGRKYTAFITTTEGRPVITEHDLATMTGGSIPRATTWGLW